MKIEPEFQPDCLTIIPTIAVVTARCECCEADSGTVISLVWLWWALHFKFITPHGPESQA